VAHLDHVRLRDRLRGAKRVRRPLAEPAAIRGGESSQLEESVIGGDVGDGAALGARTLGS